MALRMPVEPLLLSHKAFAYIPIEYVNFFDKSQFFVSIE